MPTAAQWQLMFAAAPANTPTVEPVTFLRAWHTYSKPVALSCNDGETYVVKGLQPTHPLMGRALITEHVVGRLGRLLSAPVPEIVFVDMLPGLIALEPAVAHISPGPAHGSRLMQNCGDRIGIGPPGSERNRRAYASLAVLYGWAHAGDHQLVSRLDRGLLHGRLTSHVWAGGPRKDVHRAEEVPAGVQA